MYATTRMLIKGAGVAVASFALSCAAAPGAHAKRKNASADELGGTVAHLPLNGPAVSEMSLQVANGHQYLCLNRASKEGVTIVDVTNPEKPVIVSHLSWPSRDQAGHFKMVGPRMAIVESQGSDIPGPSAAAPATETVNVIDLSDPANPHPIRTFSGVTSVVTDGPQTLAYFTNDQGLWIVRMNRDLPRAACSSEDAIAGMPSCP
jgi:hypothetical protein